MNQAYHNLSVSMKFKWYYKCKEGELYEFEKDRRKNNGDSLVNCITNKSISTNAN